jgi:hypothetical protein
MKLFKGVMIFLGLSIGAAAYASPNMTDVKILNNDKADAVCAVNIGNTHGGQLGVTSALVKAGESSTIRIPHIDVQSGDFMGLECAQDGELDRSDFTYSSNQHNWISVCDKFHPCIPTTNDTAYNIINVTLPSAFSVTK